MEKMESKSIVKFEGILWDFWVMSMIYYQFLSMSKRHEAKGFGGFGVQLSMFFVMLPTLGQPSCSLENAAYLWVAGAERKKKYPPTSLVRAGDKRTEAGSVDPEPIPVGTVSLKSHFLRAWFISM